MAFASHQSRLRPRDLGMLVALAGLLFLPYLGARDLWNPNEPIYGQAVAEMAASGSWLIPTVNGQVFAEKPILYYWMALASGKVLGGVGETSLRVPAALAGIGSVLLTALLVAPYAGRRAALLAGAILATQYQVFWASRTVQMDILVLAFTLAAVIPLLRMLDFGLHPSKAWPLAGIALGLGFVAKGPVALVIPGMIVALYSLFQGSFRDLLGRWMPVGAVAGIAVASPWYVSLWAAGHQDFLVEVLYRQNVTRFLDAWDHHQPWWYYLKYIWIDYAPWSWLLPAVALQRRRHSSVTEGSLSALSWIWILSTLLFFSLSESKRAPYILPIAPAVAALVGSYVGAWSQKVEIGRWSCRAAIAAIGAFGSVSLLGGSALLGGFLAIPDPLRGPGRVAGATLLVAGALLIASLFRSDRVRWSPVLLGASMVAIFGVASAWAFPAMDELKSARDFSTRLVDLVDRSNGDVASAGFWDWRVDYVYYAGRRIPNLDPAMVEGFAMSADRPFLLVERRRGRDWTHPLPEGAEIVLRGQIGGREAVLLRLADKDPCSEVEITAGGEESRSPESESRLHLLASAAEQSQSARAPESLPRSLSFLGTDPQSVLRSRVLAFEVEYSEAEDQETEIFVDQEGTTLFTVVKSDDEAFEHKVREDELPSDLRSSVRRILPDIAICRLQREREWGSNVLAAKWNGPSGTQELKLLEDGSLLFFELARRSVPVPEAVRRLAPSEADIEPMVLDLYWTDGETDNLAYLANGWPVRRPRGT